MKRLCTLAVLAFAVTAHAADAPSCRVVKMADPGWTDIAATNALSGIVLEALGYEQKVLPLSVPITYAGLQKNQVDVFLGNWMPAQRTLVEPLLKGGSVERLRANLPQAKFTLAVPEHVARAGVRNFADLAKHADKFGKKIYGIESGAPANTVIKKLLASNSHGLGGWTLVESSEQGMLSQVARATRSNGWIVFLAWEPHQMNNTFKLAYLDGAADDFGSGQRAHGNAQGLSRRVPQCGKAVLPDRIHGTAGARGHCRRDGRKSIPRVLRHCSS